MKEPCSFSPGNSFSLLLVLLGLGWLFAAVMRRCPVLTAGRFLMHSDMSQECFITRVKSLDIMKQSNALKIWDILKRHLSQAQICIWTEWRERVFTLMPGVHIFWPQLMLEMMKSAQSVHKRGGVSSAQPGGLSGFYLQHSKLSTVHIMIITNVLA